jgi:hypothetical protein
MQPQPVLSEKMLLVRLGLFRLRLPERWGDIELLFLKIQFLLELHWSFKFIGVLYGDDIQGGLYKKD